MNYKQKASDVAQEIIRERFYTELFLKVLEANGMTLQGVINQEYGVERVISRFNAFWAVLPDSASIRTSTFFKVCDIAEGIFDEDAYEEQLTPHSIPAEQYAEMHRAADGISDEKGYSDTERTLRAIFKRQLGLRPDDINPSSKMIKDLGADSLDLVELIMEIEDEFSLEIDDATAEKMADMPFCEVVATVEALIQPRKLSRKANND